MIPRFAPIPPPRRARFSPIIVLFVLAVIPALLLGYVWKWADKKIPPDKVATTTTTTDPTQLVPTTTLPPSLKTPILSVRRAPQTLAQLSSVSSFTAAVQDVAAFVDSTSCLVVSLNGQRIIDVNGDRAVTPASNQKLLVGAVALEALGENYAFTTTLKGTVANGVVTGDLYLVGGGDPVLSTANYPATQTHPPTSTTSLEQLAQNLAAAGVTRIQGTVVGDESRYDAERFVPTWGAGIAGVEAGPLSALLVNDATKGVGAKKLARYDDPAVGAATDFIAVLKAAGIKVGASTGRNGVAPADAATITSIQSAPLSAIVGEMLTTSDDNTAELLVKEIGLHFSPTGANRLSGLDSIRSTLVTWGLDVSRVNLIDGSGLDSSNTVTCDVLLGVLQHPGVIAGPVGLGLPVAGQSGTLATEFAGSPMIGRLHAKTGTLNSAKSLSGYVTTTAGEIDFSLILNTPGIGAEGNTTYAGIWNALGAAFATYPSGATLEQIQPR